MGDVIDFATGDHDYNPELVTEFSIEDDERKLARRVRFEIEKTGKVQGKTRLILAQNLGRILSRFGRELSRDDLARYALNTTNIKPSERLGRFQIKPGKTPSDNAEKRLSKNPKQYLKLAETAAELTKNSPDRFALDLVDGTKFDMKGALGEEISDIIPLERLEEVISAQCELIIKKWRVNFYLSERDRYNATVTKDKYGKYSFQSNIHNDYKSNVVHSVPLFSTLHSEGHCEWKKGNGKWIERPIKFVERIHFGLFSTEDNQVFSAFRINPLFYLPPIRKEGGKGRYHETLARPPFDLNAPWIGGLSILHFLGCEIGPLGDTKVGSTFSKLINIDEVEGLRLPSNHGLDLKRIQCIWAEKFKNPVKKSNTTEFADIVERLGVRSISTWLDIPVKNILRQRGDAFHCDLQLYEHAGSEEPLFDASRGISPPNSFLAEVEVGLYYDGFQGTFDDKSRDYALSMPSYPDYEEDGNGFPREIYTEDIDLTYTNTFLDLLEIDVSSQVIAFVEWHKNVQEEGLLRSAKKLEELDKELRTLKDDE